MAKLNHTGAFAGARPLQGNVSDWVNQQERMDFAHREEQRKIEDRKIAEKQRRQKLYDDRMKEFGNLDIPEGFKTGSVNEIMTNYISEAIEMQGKLGREYEQAVRKNDVRAMNDIKLKQQELNNTGKYLKSALQSYETQGLALQKGLADGSILMTPENKKRLDTIGQGGFRAFIGDDMKPMFAFMDTNNDGVVDSLDSIMSLDEIVNAQEGGFFGESVPNFDMDSYTTEIAKPLIAKVTETWDKNRYNKTKKTQVPEEVINRYELTDDQLKAIQIRRGSDISNPEVIEELNNEYREMIRSKTKNQLELEFNTGKYGTDANLAYKRSKDDKEEPKTDISYVEKVGASPSLSDDFSFNTPYQLKDKKTGVNKDGYLTGITLSKEGNIILTGEEIYGKRKSTDDDGVEITENVTRPFSFTDKKDVQSILSEVLGTTSFEDSVKELKKRIPENSTSNSGSSTVSGGNVR